MSSQDDIEAEAQRLLDEAKTRLKSLAQKDEYANISSELDLKALRLKTGWSGERLKLEIEHRSRIDEEIEREQLPPDEALKRIVVELPKRLDSDPRLAGIDQSYLENVRNAIKDIFARLG